MMKEKRIIKKREDIDSDKKWGKSHSADVTGQDWTKREREREKKTRNKKGKTEQKK